MSTDIELPEGHPPVSPDGDSCLPDGHPPVDGFEFCNPQEDDESNDDSSDTPAGPPSGPPSSGGGNGDGMPAPEGDPVYVTYHDGRRSNAGMGLYYLGGTHRIGLAEYGLAQMAQPNRFKPLWMNEDKNIYTSLFDAPRPGGTREGEVTGIIREDKTTYVVFKDENDKFKKQAFKMSKKEGMASSAEEKASNSWINKKEKEFSVDLNGDDIFGKPSKKKLKKMTEAELNNDRFESNLSSEELLDGLQKGGHVIYLRHTTTETDYADQADPNLDLDDPSTQRMLSEQGIAEAESIGAGIKANDILIGKVFTSEYQRAKDTAEIAFGKYQVNDELNFLPFEEYTPEQLDTYHDRIAPMLSKKPGNKKKNTVLVGHDDPFEGTTNIYPDPQGTAYILKPYGERYDIIAKLGPDDWAFGADI